jgi:TatD DNase family protein
MTQQTNAYDAEPSLNLFDTHVNLHGEAFKEDIGAVLDRARSVGVRRFVNICDTWANAQAVLEIAQAHADITATVGTHPHHAKDVPDITARHMIDFAAHPKIVGIGETGLDLHYGYSPLDQQEHSFLEHVIAARETGLVLVIHCREADAEMQRLLETEMARGEFRFLLHCYTGGEKLAACAVELGGYFSLSGIASFKSAKDVRRVMGNVPPERVVLETDCPYLAPVPMRGRRNEPAFLVHVCKAFSELYGISMDESANLTTRTAHAVFGRP